ncbi:MAG: tol-pal system protein YbgF [Nitrospinae bacterium]|nr:tol-pal system protein YbgF [Nitrospinota bacterium]
MRVLPIFLLTALLAASCATRDDVGQLETRIRGLEQESSKSRAELLTSSNDIKKNQLEIQSALAAIRDESSRIMSELDKKQKRLDENLTVALKNQADSRGDHDIITSRLNAAIGSLDETIHRLKMMEEKERHLDESLRDARNDMMESFLSLNQKLETGRPAQSDEPAKKIEPKKKNEPAADQDKVKEDDNSSPPPPVKTKPEKAAPKKGKSTKKEASPDLLYNSAYDEFMKGDFPKALAKFSEYVKRYPNTDLSYNSQFWIGESFASLGKTKEAVDAFNLTAANYPRSTKAPTALWRAGELLGKNGAEEEMRAILRKLRDNYPASNEAMMADEKLKSLGENGKQE